MGRGLRSALTIAIVTGAAACGLSLSGTGGDFAPDDAGTADDGAQGSDVAPPADDATTGTDGSGGGGDGGGAQPDAGGDGGAKNDAGTEAGVDATPPRDAGTDTAPPPTITCPAGGTVSDCAACSGYPLLCAMCKTGAVQLVCVPPGSSCYDSYRANGYDWCRCTIGSGAACVLPQQECNTYGGGVCVTCGERQTQGFPCKSGGTCNETAAKCQ